MRKRYIILLVAMFLLLAAVFLGQSSQPREPMYEGRPLSYWLEGYTPDTQTETSRQSADNAMREIGTKVIPTLLRMLQAYDSPVKVKFFKLIEKQHFLKIHHVEATERNMEGRTGFEILGASARIAVPSLIEIYERDISEASRFSTAMSLGAVGPAAKDAVPILLSSMTSANPGTRAGGILALGKIHSDAELVLPSLLKVLGDSDRALRGCAAEALGRFGADGKPAVPALIKSLNNDPDPIVRATALSALKQIDPQIAATLSTNLSPASIQSPH